MIFHRLRSVVVLLGFVGAVCASALGAGDRGLDVTRATLPNGLRVIVVRDPLAPVVTAEMNYRVGSNDQQYPGQAHALEHMMFRGSDSLSMSQLADISELIGGDGDADTTANVTQFFFTAPSQYLDLLLRLESSRMRGLQIKEDQWDIERGAIKQEVTQDDSIPIRRLLERDVLPAIFRGTPYANDTLGTLYGFNHEINARRLRALYNAWYHPNNAVYVIAGDVDGPSTIDAVKKYFGGFSAVKIPAHRPVTLQPVKYQQMTVDSDQPYTLTAVAMRFPGFAGKDYAASQVLMAVLNNQRGDLFGLSVSGKVYYAGIQSIDEHAQASAVALLTAQPIAMKPADGVAALRVVIDRYKKTGVSAELVEVAKRRAVADDEFTANSISGLANEWSDAVAGKGLSSPDSELDAYRKVTVADVNRVLRKDVDFDRAIIAFAVPKNLGKIDTNPPPPPATEVTSPAITRHDPLPVWATDAFKRIRVPEQTIHPVDERLANGLRLIVVPEHVSPTVEVSGTIASDEAVQAAANLQGVADITAASLPFGTTTLDRLAMRRQLDAIAAETSVGTSFSLSTLSDRFDRAVELLADEELHPAFPAANVATMKEQELQQVQGDVTTPDHLLSVELNKLLYPATDPRQIIATPASVGNVTRDDVKAWFASVYRPDMTTIVVIGDVTPEQARSVFAKYFGGWRAFGPKPDVSLPAVPNNAAASAIVPAVGRSQSQVDLVEVNALKRSDPDWATLAVADAAFGSGGNSTLYRDVRGRHGLVYSIYSALSSWKNRSTFSISFASDPDKLENAQRLALADLASLSSHGLTPDDLARGKAMLVSDIPLREQSFDGIAAILARYASLGLPLEQAMIDAQREVATSNDAIVAAIARWIRPADFVRVILGPGPK